MTGSGGEDRPLVLEIVMKDSLAHARLGREAFHGQLRKPAPRETANSRANDLIGTRIVWVRFSRHRPNFTLAAPVAVDRLLLHDRRRRWDMCPRTDLDFRSRRRGSEAIREAGRGVGDGVGATVRKQVRLQIGKASADADDFRLSDQILCERGPQEGDYEIA